VPQIDFRDYKAFALDFDGTLADTVATHNLARQKAFELMAEQTGDEGFVNISPEIQAEAHRHGSNPTAIIGWALQASGLVKEITDEKVARTVNYKREKYAELCKEGLEQIPGSVEFAKLLLGLSQSNVGITTTAYKEAEVVPFLRRYDLHEQIRDDHLVTFEDVGPDHLKPDPRAYLLTLQRFGLIDTPEKLLIFEDTPGGIASAKEAGAIAVAVTTTHAKSDFVADTHEYKPDFIVSTFAELIQMAAQPRQ
jgi:HAD superfamily hydrolase (TIGR01509 family)